MYRSILIPTLGSVLTLVSCGDQDFQKEYTEAKSRAGQGDFVSRLVSLDQKYPDRLPLKVDLGAVYLSRGSLDQAWAYLSRGETLASSGSDDAVKSVLWADLSQLSLLEGEPDAAIKYAGKSLQNKDEKLGVIFTRAKAFLLKNDRKSALADFQSGWDSHRKTMTPQDFGLYAKTLLAEKSWARALEVVEAYWESFPYELTSGLVESVCYENLGRYDESVLAAFVDVDYQRSRGLISSPQVLANIRNLETRIQSRGLAPEKSGLTTLKSVEAWVLKDWKRVEFDGHLLQDSPVARFLKLSAELELGRVSELELKTYSDLENRFHDFPSYYVPLLHFLKDTQEDYRNVGFATLAEKLVDLAPAGSEADEGRKNLALGYGLVPDMGSSLLTRGEVTHAVAQEDWARLGRLFATPDNPSIQFALERLQARADDPAIRAAIQPIAASSSGRAKERWNLVLQAR